MRLNTRSWLGEAAQALDKGFVITIDYGYEAAELYSHQGRFGTLQTYYRHTEGGSPYQRIGRQDISAHVDFSQLQSDGRCRLDLSAIAYTTQADLLQALGIDDMLRQVRTMPLSSRERSANLMAMRELIKPSGLGGFKALIQAKGVEASAADIAPSAGAARGSASAAAVRPPYAAAGWTLPARRLASMGNARTLAA